MEVPRLACAEINEARARLVALGANFVVEICYSPERLHAAFKCQGGIDIREPQSSVRVGGGSGSYRVSSSRSRVGSELAAWMVVVTAREKRRQGRSLMSIRNLEYKTKERR